jgi:hypothetical protein
MNLTHSNNRLLKLADYLEQLPRGAINMETWLKDKKADNNSTTVDRLNGLATQNDNFHIELKAAPIEQVRECGYAACAVGWACTIPAFRKAGLKMQSIQAVYDTTVNFKMTPRYKNAEGFEAAAKFFGIDEDVAEYLFESDAFGWSGKPRPESVARRIRKVVQDRQAGKNPLPDRW